MSNNLNFYEIVAGADNSRAMESETIQKNGAGPKSHTSRGNFLKPKKLLMLAFVMLLSVAGAWAQHVDGGTTGPLTWELTGTGNNLTLTISGEGAMPDYEWNSEWNNYSAPWYSYRSSIKTVIIEDGVTRIGAYAFDADTSYGPSYSITSVSLPNSITKIGRYAFSECRILTSILIPNSVTTIEQGAFSSCRGLTSMVIPYGVTKIDNYVFYDCRLLTSITIPNGVTTIGNYAFSACKSLQTVDFNATNCTAMGSSEYPVFQGCTINTLNIGNMVTSIPDCAFKDCGGFTSVVIPENVITVGTQAFTNVEELTISRIYSSFLTSISSTLKRLTIGMDCASIGSGTLKDCNNLTDLTLPYIGTSLSAVTSLSTLFGSTGVPGSLEKLIITRPAEQIAAHALSGCNKLKEVTVPSTVRGLGEGAMYGCNGLDHIYSHWAYPPSAYNNSTFEGVNKYACILHVPIGSKEKYASADGWKEFNNIQEEAAVTITARPIPLYGGIIEGVLQYNYDETATLIASGNMGYDFQAWMENETIVSTNKEYSFLVEGPRTLYAIFTPRENENGVEVITHPTEAVIIWDGEPGASGYTLIIYLDAERTIEYVRFEFDEFGNPRGTISCIVTDLTEGDRYYYTLTAYDEEHYALTIAIGNFVTGEADIETIETSTVKIYPNPVKDVLTITNYESGITSVKIYDLLGKEVMESNLSDGKVDVSPLSPRGYILRIVGYAVRFVKE